MIRLLCILSITFLLSVGDTGCHKKAKQQYFESIVGLTSDELPVFVVLKSENKDSIYLITNLELHWRLYPQLNIHGEYLDTLRTLLSTGALSKDQCLKLDKSKVSIDGRAAMQGYSTTELYNRFFDDQGLPLGNQKDEDLSAAVSILIERGIIVQQGKAAMYNIYVKP